MFYLYVNMISPISASINKNIRYNSKSGISFGTVSRAVKDKNDTLLYRNDTRMFREDLNWKFLLDYIKSKKVPQKIYCYACSDGSEPYSIAIGLIHRLGYEKAKAFFPIIAIDRDHKMIKRAKDRIIDLDETDLKRIKKYQNPVPFYQIKYKRKSKKSLCGENRPMSFIVDGKLASCVEFKVGNIIDDVDKINYKNSIIFLRNVLPYLGKEREHALLSNLSKYFDKTTSLVIGAFDKTTEYDDFLFDEKMWKKKFYRVRPLIYEKYIPQSGKSKIKTIISTLSNEFSNSIFDVCEYFRSLAIGMSQLEK